LRIDMLAIRRKVGQSSWTALGASLAAASAVVEHASTFDIHHIVKRSGLVSLTLHAGSVMRSLSGDRAPRIMARLCLLCGSNPATKSQPLGPLRSGPLAVLLCSARLCAKGVTVETPRTGLVTVDLRLDWDRVGLLFATFGVACGGLATVFYSIGFLIQALSHHV
jgi:hypothetical protein